LNGPFQTRWSPQIHEKWGGPGVVTATPPPSGSTTCNCRPVEHRTWWFAAAQVPLFRDSGLQPLRLSEYKQDLCRDQIRRGFIKPGSRCIGRCERSPIPGRGLYWKSVRRKPASFPAMPSDRRFTLLYVSPGCSGRCGVCRDQPRSLQRAAAVKSGPD
jgi:hypothetical protein